MSANMKGVIPYLVAKNASEAADFYKAAFAATEIDRRPTPDGRLMHCHLEINGGALMMCDAFPEHGHAWEPVKSVMLTLIVTDGDLWWDRAIAAGCEVVSPFKLEFWGDRYGQLRDPQGVVWAINEPAKKD